MPIRMVDDEPGGNTSDNFRDSNNSSNSGGFSSGNGGIGGSLVNILSAFLPYLIKKPKLLILIIALGLIYFLFFRN